MVELKFQALTYLEANKAIQEWLEPDKVTVTYIEDRDRFVFTFPTSVNNPFVGSYFLTSGDTLRLATLIRRTLRPTVEDEILAALERLETTGRVPE